MTSTFARLLVAFLLLVLAGRAEALTCSFVQVSGPAFGAYDPIGGWSVDTTASVTYRCTGVQAFDQVLIELGQGSGASYLPRTLMSGASSLAYNVYLDAARTQVWGDGTSGTYRYGPVLPPEDTNVTVDAFARIPGGQNVPAGSYGDTLVVTMVF